MAAVFTYHYDGTGLWRELPWIPVRPGRIYYGPLLRSATEAADHSAHHISLRFAGLGPPELRHKAAFRVARHKARKYATEQAFRLPSGHSQGGNQSVDDALTHLEETAAAIGWAAPRNGSPLTKRGPKWLPVVGAMHPDGPEVAAMRLREQQAAARYRLGQVQRLPEIHLVSSQCDWLVPCESAHTIDPSYPEELVFRYCLASDPNHKCHPEARIIMVPRWHDNHFVMVRTGPVFELMREIITGVAQRLGESQPVYRRHLSLVHSQPA